MINISAPVVNITINHPPTDLGPIEERLSAMATAQDQAAEELGKIGDTLDKVSTEVTSMVGDVRIMKDELAAMGTISPNLRAALDRVASKADSIDALIDDVAPNPTNTPVPASAPPGTQPSGDTGSSDTGSADSGSTGTTTPDTGSTGSTGGNDPAGNLPNG